MKISQKFYKNFRKNFRNPLKNIQKPQKKINKNFSTTWVLPRRSNEFHQFQQLGKGQLSEFSENKNQEKFRKNIRRIPQKKPSLLLLINYL